MADDAYGSIARFYDKYIDGFNAPLRELAIRLTEPSESTKVLDVGCGTGSFVEALAATGADVHGVDLSEAMLAIARERVGTVAHLQIADATTLPYANDEFGLTCASLFLHELDPEARRAVLTEMARVTSASGQLVLIDYRIGSLRFKGWIARTVSAVAERIAGSEHHRNWRTYMATGGMPGEVERLGLHVTREKIAAGGNMAIWLIEPGT